MQFLGGSRYHKLQAKATILRRDLSLPVLYQFLMLQFTLSVTSDIRSPEK